MADEDVRVPAGWYPDPLGLPQLRWWDNHAWTEHTSDARQPMVAQETVTPLLAFADDEPEDDLPQSRRERERLADDPEPEPDGVGDATTTDLAYGDPLLVLEAPLRDQRSTEEPSPAARLAAEGLPADAPTSAPYNLDTRFDDLLGEPSPFDLDSGPRAAYSHVNDAASGLRTDAAREPGSRTQRRGTSTVDPADLPVSTGPVWAIALMPLLILVFGLLFLLSGTVGSFSAGFAIGVLAVPYLVVVGLAIADRSILARAGYEHPPHWAWALLTAPAYLIVRLASVVRETGRGFGPLLAWVGLAALTAVSVVAVPGLVLALSPATFAAEAEASVASDASILGARLAVDCPDVPPLLVSQSFSCMATNEDGETFPVLVSLQRANGWVDWRVDNWGVYTTGN